MKVHELFESSYDLNAEIEDAAKAIGTLAELTPEVRKQVEDYLQDPYPIKLKTAGDGKLESIMYEIKKDKKRSMFAFRIACKVLGVRLNESTSQLADDPLNYQHAYPQGTQVFKVDHFDWSPMPHSVVHKEMKRLNGQWNGSSSYNFQNEDDAIKAKSKMSELKDLLS